MAAKKAAAAATAVRSGTGKKMVKRRTKVHFYRPKSFQPPKAPKYALKAAPSRTKTPAVAGNGVPAHRTSAGGTQGTRVSAADQLASSKALVADRGRVM